MQVKANPSSLRAGLVNRPRPVLRCAAEPVVKSQEAATTSNTCKTCGVDLSKKPFGCDGEGRVVGGIGAVPGMSWWPIKAYRPCPVASSAGFDYVRKGQATNEMLFGGVSLGQSGAQSLDAMKQQQDRGLDVDV